MDNFCILENTIKQGSGEIADRVVNFLRKKGKKVCLIQDGAYTPEGTECLIVLGGDGTVLRAARKVKDKDAAIIGINLGNMGYLSEVGVPDLDAALEKLIRGEYTIEERMMIEGRIYRDGKVIKQQTALNDIYFIRRGPLMVMKFENYVNGEFLNAIEADGEIIATPTGSTGYSLSAGGPVVTPQAKVMVLTPVCAHALNSRSIVLRKTDVVTVVIGEGRSKRDNVAVISFDGDDTSFVETGDKIEIKRSDCRTRLIKLSNMSFLEILRSKMQDSSYLR